MTERIGVPDLHVVVQQNPFAQVPEALLYDTRLGDKAVRVYGVLLRHGTDPANCYPSHERIAKFIGCSKRSIARPLDELENTGWVARRKRYDANGARTSDGYVVRLSAQESATTTQENVDPPRSGTGTHHAPERDEREPLNESKVNERRKARASARPPAWEPNAAHRAKAAEHGIDLDHEAEQFQSFHDAKGSRFVDWDAAFHTWLGNARKWARSSTGRQSFFSEDFTQAAIDRVFGRGA